MRRRQGIDAVFEDDKVVVDGASHAFGKVGAEVAVADAGVAAHRHAVDLHARGVAEPCAEQHEPGHVVGYFQSLGFAGEFKSLHGVGSLHGKIAALAVDFHFNRSGLGGDEQKARHVPGVACRLRLVGFVSDCGSGLSCEIFAGKREIRIGFSLARIVLRPARRRVDNGAAETRHLAVGGDIAHASASVLLLEQTAYVLCKDVAFDVAVAYDGYARRSARRAGKSRAHFGKAAVGSVIFY